MYLGGKARHSKEIVNVILNMSAGKTTWIEPFVGAGSVITKVPKHMSIYGSDIDSDLIALLQYVQQGGELPNTVTHDCYKAVKANPEHFSKHFVAFVSIGCSFSGKKWGGFARGCTPKGRQRNYALESRNKLMSMDFKNIHFEHKTYSEVSVNETSIVYCDPPYAGTTGYKTKFDSGSFWEWAEKSAKVADVYVSEYNAPPGWECIWEKETARLSGNASAGKRATEKLFRLNKQEMTL